MKVPRNLQPAKSQSRGARNLNRAASTQEPKNIAASLRPSRNMEVQRFLTALAQLLIPAGITPKRFSELAKNGFVQAASDLSRFRNGKVNHSRVAVLTGLTRVEVKRLLSSSKENTSRKAAQQNRAERVVSAWELDSRYLDDKGRPRKLSIRGKGPTFVSLVKRNAGDVPYRAVLNELVRLKIVSQTKDQVILRSSYWAKQNSAFEVLATLLQVLSEEISNSNSKTPPLHYRLRLTARTPLDLSLLKNRASEGMTTLLDGLKASLPHSKPRSRSKATPGNTLTIASIITANDKSQRR